jgi:hypothetical protein
MDGDVVPAPLRPAGRPQPDEFLLRLPDETLVHIVLLTRSPLEIMDLRESPVDIQDTLHVMRVCARLYNVMVRSPQLWVCVDTRWPRARIDTSVQRAGHCRLDLIAQVFDWKDTE